MNTRNEELAREITRKDGMDERQGNCFTFINDFSRAKTLAHEFVKIPWGEILGNRAG